MNDLTDFPQTLIIKFIIKNTNIQRIQTLRSIIQKVSEDVGCSNLLWREKPLEPTCTQANYIITLLIEIIDELHLVSIHHILINNEDPVEFLDIESSVNSLV